MYSKIHVYSQSLLAGKFLRLQVLCSSSRKLRALKTSICLCTEPYLDRAIHFTSHIYGSPNTTSVLRLYFLQLQQKVSITTYSLLAAVSVCSVRRVICSQTGFRMNSGLLHSYVTMFAYSNCQPAETSLLVAWIICWAAAATANAAASVLLPWNSSCWGHLSSKPSRHLTLLWMNEWQTNKWMNGWIFNTR